jgi:hypothetical protein
MLICSNNECKGENEDGSEFCQHCGEALSIATRHTSIPGVRTRKADGSAQGAVAMIERSVWFRIARGFAWLILVLSLLGLVGGVVYSARSVRQYFKGEETISASDVKTAIEARRAGASGMEGLEASPGHLDSKAEGQLTTEAIDIFNLLPPESQNRFGGKERVRLHLVMSAANIQGGDVNVQVSFLQEMKKVLADLQPQERLDGVEAFVRLKQKNKQEAAAKKLLAGTELLVSGGIVWSLATLITLVSMVLALLAIERNTRSRQEST